MIYSYLEINHHSNNILVLFIFSFSVLDYDDIAAQAVIFFIAGFETVSTAMSFVAYELAVNPHIQKRLREEVDKTLDECGGKITYDAVNKMHYLDMIISGEDIFTSVISTHYGGPRKTKVFNIIVQVGQTCLFIE